MTNDRDRGFTLTEVLFALVLMVTAVLGAAHLATTAARLTRDARLSTSALALAQQKVEQLSAITWAVNEGGVLLSDDWTDLAVDPPRDSGIGLRASSSAALLSNMAGFVDFLDASGVWVGTGASPPAGTAFVRRWSVEPTAGASDRTLLLRVFVTTVGRGGDRGAAGATSAGGADTALASLRTRSAR
jgi:prepilin-type N-terminal cleavage/methylation domain-containing protein